MNLLLVKATFKPNNPVCAGFIIAAIPYTSNIAAARTTFQELAVQLGFYNTAPGMLILLAELPTGLLHPEYMANWERPDLHVIAYVNGEY